MKSIYNIFLAVIFWVGVTEFSHKIYNEVKKESLTKVQKGLPSLTKFTKKLMQK